MYNLYQKIIAQFRRIPHHHHTTHFLYFKESITKGRIMSTRHKNIPNIFGYNDFRKYLADFQQARQVDDHHFSKSEFSRLLQLPNTRSYLNDILNGKKVTTTFIERFITVLELDKDEAKYFRVLVSFNQAETPDERELYFEQLIALNKTPKKILDPKLFVYYKYWYNSVIRALLDIMDFSDDYAALSKKVFPTITVSEAKSSITLLKDLGLIAKNDKGFYKPTDKSITTPDFIRDELVKSYQLNCLDMAKTAMMKGNVKPFSVNTNMISISQNGYKRLEKQIIKFRSEVRSLVHKDEEPAENVFLLNITLIPTSK
jgi:uncharacterized protein (TIGR02147 family)